MSFDAIAVWPLPGTDPVASALAEDESEDVGLADLRGQFMRLQSGLPGSPDDWSSHHAGEGDVECDHHPSEVQLLFTAQRIFISVPYYRDRSNFDHFIAVLRSLALAGATIVDVQSGAVCDPHSDVESLWQVYDRVPLPRPDRPSPPMLGRRGYALGLLTLIVATFVVQRGIVEMELDRIHPAFAMAPFVIALLCKMFVLDLRRLRDLGRDERMILWNILVPIGQLALLPLFYQRSRDT